MKNKTQAFTLVELIVVITILAILATIGFVSFSGYLAGTRDTNRIAQLKAMSDALELYTTKKDLPLPDDKVEIKAGTTTIAYQGYIGKNVLETIEYTEAGLDPKDKTYFSYYLTKNKTYFQLLSFLEEENTNIHAYNISPLSKGSPLKEGGVLMNAQATDYSERYPKVTGKKLGILTDENNMPIQDITTIQTSGLDLSDVGTTTSYKSIVADDEIITGSGTELSGTHSTASCKRIKQLKGSSSDGVYTIDPASDGTGFKVYCDMTTDGGGWTLVNNSLLGSESGEFFTRVDSISGDGIKINITADAPGCGNPNVSKHKIIIAPDIRWEKVRFSQDFYGGGACWKIFGDTLSGYESNLEIFDLNKNIIRDELKMNTVGDNTFDGDTYRCDNSTTSNFWHPNKGTGLRHATIILPKKEVEDQAGLFTYVSCNIVGTTQWTYKNIFVR